MPRKTRSPKDRHQAIMRQVGANIRRHRQQAGLSQTGLAEPLGLTFQQIQKYERGSNRTGPGVLVDLAKLLNCSVMDFFEGVEDADNQVSVEEKYRRQDLMRLSRRLGALPDRQRLAVHNLVTAMAIDSHADA